MTAGYSGTPLAKKLSLKDGMTLWVDNMPASVRADIEQHGLDLHFTESPQEPLQAAHVFVTRREILEVRLRELLPLLGPSAFIWVSWPKKAAKQDTDITEDVIRDVALPMGLVDVKVCAIDATWSGLKLMKRRT